MLRGMGRIWDIEGAVQRRAVQRLREFGREAWEKVSTYSSIYLDADSRPVPVKGKSDSNVNPLRFQGTPTPRPNI